MSSVSIIPWSTISVCRPEHHLHPFHGLVSPLIGNYFCFQPSSVLSSISSSFILQFLPFASTAHLAMFPFHPAANHSSKQSPIHHHVTITTVTIIAELTTSSSFLNQFLQHIRRQPLPSCQHILSILPSFRLIPHLVFTLLSVPPIRSLYTL